MIHHCDICSYGTSRESNLTRHKARVHEGQRQNLECHLCGKILSDKNCLTRHFKACHPAGNVYFENGNISTSSLQTQEQSKKANNAEEKTIKCHKCHICGKLLSDKNCLTRHLKTSHPAGNVYFENGNISSSLIQEQSKEANNAEEKSIKCHKCGEMFNEKGLRLHLKNKHPGVKAFDNNKIPPSKTNSSGGNNVLKNNKNVNNYNKMYYCHMCKTAEIDLKSLKIHITNEHNKTMEPIKCEQCVETFIERYSQMKHFEKFHQQLYYQYYQKFADFFNQTGVTNVHEGEKNVTNVQKDEKNITNIHEGETKREIYKCEKCNKCFGTQSSLEKHAAYFHENFQLNNISNNAHEEKNIHEGQNYLQKPLKMEFLNPVPPASKKAKLELPNDIKPDMDIYHGENYMANIHEEQKPKIIPMETILPPPISSKKAKILLPNEEAIGQFLGGKKLRVLMPKTKPEPSNEDNTKKIDQEFDQKNQKCEEKDPKVLSAKKLRVLMPKNQNELNNTNPFNNEDITTKKINLQKFGFQNQEAEINLKVHEKNTTLQQLSEMNQKIEIDYSKETNLQRHMRAVATGVKRYNCFKCGKFQFMTSENALAQIHMNTCHRGIIHVHEGKKTCL